MEKNKKRRGATPTKYVPTNKRSYGWLWGMAVVLVVAVIVGVSIFMGVRKANEVEDGSDITVKHAAVKVTDMYVEFRGEKADKKAKIVDIYEDPRCPMCSEMEKAQAGKLAEAIEDGRAVVRFYLMNFLDAAGSSAYSTRANAAVIAVARTGDASAAYTLHSMIWHQAPPESPDAHEFTNEELGEMAKKAGANDEVVQEISRGEGSQMAATAMGGLNLKHLNKITDNQAGTPAVYVNKKVVDNPLQNTKWVSNL